MSEISLVHFEIGDHGISMQYRESFENLGVDLVKIPSGITIDAFRRWSEHYLQHDRDLGENFTSFLIEEFVPKQANLLDVLADSIGESVDRGLYRGRKADEMAMLEVVVNKLSDEAKSITPDNGVSKILSARVVTGMEDDGYEALFQALMKNDLDYYIKVLRANEDAFVEQVSDEELEIIASDEMVEFNAGRRVLDITLYDIYRQMERDRQLGSFGLRLVKKADFKTN